VTDKMMENIFCYTAFLNGLKTKDLLKGDRGHETLKNKIRICLMKYYKEEGASTIDILRLFKINTSGVSYYLNRFKEKIAEDKDYKFWYDHIKIIHNNFRSKHV